MLNVVYVECLKYALYAECRYAECRYFECRGALTCTCKVSRQLIKEIG
jgi:hypothetical protein